jgi:hypothetical protein
MQIEQFADKHRLKARRDECNDTIIPGKFGQIYDNCDGRLGVMYMPDPHGKRDSHPGRWNNRKRKLLAAGCQIKNDGDVEGIALFDPESPAQIRLAIQVAGIKRKRAVSDEQAAHLRSIGFKNTHATEAVLALDSIGKAGDGTQRQDMAL